MAAVIKKFVIKSYRSLDTTSHAILAIDELVKEGAVIKTSIVLKGRNVGTYFLKLSPKAPSERKNFAPKRLSIIQEEVINGDDVWFASDLHFTGSDEIITFLQRKEKWGCKDHEEMNETIISSWNTNVKTQDIVFVIGDIGVSKYLQRTNGKKILIKGNHDRQDNVDIIILSYRGIRFVLIHDPYQLGIIPDIINDPNTWVIHGHFHTRAEVDWISRWVNVGLDINRKPVTLNYLYDITQRHKMIVEEGESINTHPLHTHIHE